jgi:hypothetical protein
VRSIKELETNCASLIQEKHALQVKLRKVLNAAAKVEGKDNQRKEQVRSMTGRRSNSSKKLKPFVDPQIWKDLEEPVQGALRGLCTGFVKAMASRPDALRPLECFTSCR